MRGWVTLIVVLLGSGALLAKDAEKLKDSLQDDLVHDSWIYEDVDRGYAEAKRTGKPLLVSFRCVP